MEADIPNVSYTVNMNIPAECTSYRIFISNNVYDLQCKSGITTRLLNSKKPTQKIDHKDQSVTFSITFDADEKHIFNYLLDRSDIDITELLHALDAANKFFEEYEMSCKSQNCITKYINNLSRYTRTWTGLTSKPDYNLTLFSNRMLPYFNLGSNVWAKASMDAMKKKDYPVALFNEISIGPLNVVTETTGLQLDEFQEEIKMAKRNNNFLEWQILPYEKYPNMKEHLDKIKILAKLGLKKQAIHLICKLMLSPRDCHIVREPEIWKILKPEMTNKDFTILVKYCMFYAFYILKQEETVMFTKITDRSRVLFKLEEAVHLPTLANCHIDRTPYIVQLTDDTPLSQCMPFYLHGKRKINSKEKFLRRFDIATGGAFRGFDFQAIGAAITGSILVPCVHQSPLEEGFDDLDWNRQRNGTDMKYPYMIDTPENLEDEAFSNYLEYYYPSYVSLTDEDYNTHVLGSAHDIVEKQNDTGIEYENFRVDTASTDTNADLDGQRPENTLKTNLENTSKTHSENKRRTWEKFVETKIANNEKDEIDPTKQEVPEDKSVRAVEYNQLADIDISITTRDTEVFKERAIKLYETIKKNCEHRGAVYIKEVKTISSMKYKIYGPGLPRPIDVFKIPYEPIKMVKKFHMNVVKMYYNGDLILLRSCVSSLLSGVGENYKWFSCNKVPVDVILKYAQRGISLILNKKERDSISNYITESDRWSFIPERLKINPEKMYCCVTYRHPFFRPGTYGAGIRKGLRVFERTAGGMYANSLVVSQLRYSFPYGDVMTHTTKKIQMPNPKLISDMLDYIYDVVDIGYEESDLDVPDEQEEESNSDRE